MAEGTCWQERGKQKERYRKLRETKRCWKLCSHQEGDALAWSSEGGETCWRLLEIASKMEEKAERGSGAASCMFLPGMKRWQRGRRSGRARKLSSGNKNKRDSVRFTFLLTDNGKIGGKVLYKVKHSCVYYLYVWTKGHQGDLCRGWFSLFETLSL